ncbi:MAG TPA: serine/threonine-protein kinase [Blastocatellia bacterium]
MTRETTEERTRKRWKQAMDLFEEAFLLAPTERERVLDSACRQDPELRSLLKDLFSASRDAESGGFLESPAWSYQPVETNPRTLEGKRVGAYKLKKYLAQGGMGIVYLAERADKAFRREVAIKFINAKLKHYSRFRREVQILADLKHPNLVMLYDAGRLGDGRPYIVMEYVEGESLRDWSQRRGPVSAAKVVEIIKQACAGLHAAHEAGVIHRDIKPANIILSENGDKLTVKVLDFGVAARRESGDSGVSTTKGAIGTLLYMSPEQVKPLKGKDLTPASDIYALALTAYELLTGSPANDGQSQGEIILKHLEETPEPPSRRRPDLNIPRSFDRAILKALAKPPGDRYQNAPEFAAALEETFKQKTKAWDTTADQLQSQQSKPTAPPVISIGSVKPPEPAVSKEKSQVVAAIQKPAGKTKIAPATKAAVAAVAVLTVAFGVYLFRPAPSSPTTTPAPVATPTSSRRPESTLDDLPKGLIVKLGIERPKGVPFNYCQFTLFKPEVTSRPANITAESALIIREEVNSEGTSRPVKEQRVPPGKYLVSLDCLGFKPFVERVTITEDPQRAGQAIVPLRLEPK